MEDWEYHCICPDGEDCPVHGKGGVELLEQARADNAALVEACANAVRNFDLSDGTTAHWVAANEIDHKIRRALTNHGAAGAALLAELTALRRVRDAAQKVADHGLLVEGNFVVVIELREALAAVPS